MTVSSHDMLMTILQANASIKATLKVDNFSGGICTLTNVLALPKLYKEFSNQQLVLTLFWLQQLLLGVDKSKAANCCDKAFLKINNVNQSQIFHKSGEGAATT